MRSGLLVQQEGEGESTCTRTPFKGLHLRGTGDNSGNVRADVDQSDALPSSRTRIRIALVRETREMKSHAETASKFPSLLPTRKPRRNRREEDLIAA